MSHKFDHFKVADSDEDSSNPTPPPQKEEEKEEEVAAPPPAQEQEEEQEQDPEGADEEQEKEEAEVQPPVAEPPAPAPVAPAAEEAVAEPAAPAEPPHEETTPAAPVAVAEAPQTAEKDEKPFADTPPAQKKKAAATTAAKKSGTPKKEVKKEEKKKTVKKAATAPAAPKRQPTTGAAAAAPAAEKKKKATTSPQKKTTSPKKKKEASPERTATGKTKVQTTTTKKNTETPSSPTVVKKKSASSPFGKRKPAASSPDKVHTVKQESQSREQSPPPKATQGSHTPKGTTTPRRPSSARAGAADGDKANGPIYSRASRKSTTPLSAQATTPVRRSVRAGPARSHPEEEYHHDPGRAMQADDPVFLQIRRQRRASSTGSMAVANERHPFVLVAAGQPIPHLPPALEAALETHYVDGLLRLPLPEIERVVAALCPTQDHKPVMTHFKLLLQQQQATHRLSGANSPRHRRLSSPEQVSEQGWCRSTKMEEPSTSMARAARPASAGASGRRRLNATRSEEGAVRNFKHVFGNEVRAVFLEECAAVCLNRRARFYREQPRMVVERGIVVPDEIIDPFYEQAVNKLMYRLFGWTEEEAINYSPNVVAIVKDELPPLQHTQETVEPPFTDPEA